MTEVEKLYSLAGIENYRLINFCGFIPDGYKAIREKDNPNKAKEIVRDFTAEKQIQLILFILNTFKQGFNCRVEDGKISLDTLSRGIAQEVINCWQDLTEAEQNEIRRILE